MRLADQIRRWRRAGVSGLLCLAIQGFAIAQTETATPPKKPATASATPAKKSTHRASGTATKSASTHSTVHKSTRTRTSAQKGKGSRTKKGKQVGRKRGQQAIDSVRAREIQTALIREHYMQGEPSGTWDAATQAAMQRYQADQGWQSKNTPDSRALIKLGLGPSHDHLLNPESAMTTTATPAAGNPKPNAKQAPSDNVPQQ